MAAPTARTPTTASTPAWTPIWTSRASSSSFFRRHLAEAGVEQNPPVRIFVMGENRWRDEDDWALARAAEERWFLHGEAA